MSDTDTNGNAPLPDGTADDQTALAQAPAEGNLVSYAPGHGPDGPIPDWTPPEPAPSATPAERITDIIHLLQDLLADLKV